MTYFSGIETLELDCDFVIGVYPDTPQQEFSRPILPLYTVRYFEEKEVEPLQVLRAIRDNSTLNQVTDLPSRQFLLAPDEFRQQFANFPQALDNLARLIQTISASLLLP